MENLADIYYKELLESENSSLVLMKFFCMLYGQDENRTDISLFSDLVKTYGKLRVFQALLDMSYSIAKNEKSINYLREALKRALAKNFGREKGKYNPANSANLAMLSLDRKELIENAKEQKLIIPDIFEDADE